MWTVALRCNNILLKKMSIISSLAMYEAQFTQNSLSNHSFYWQMWLICMNPVWNLSQKFQIWICIGITKFLPQNFPNDGKFDHTFRPPKCELLTEQFLKKSHANSALVHILQQNCDFTGAYPWWLEKSETQLHRESVFMWFQAETVRLAVLLRIAPFIVQL